jgi:predicted nucleic acid-binding protein
MTTGQVIFVDTSAWVALADRRDAHHRKAASVFPSLLRQSRSLVTSNLVIAETYILLRKEMGRTAAASFLEKIKASPRVMKICSDEETESEAEKILAKYKDQDFSYTDAVSFAIMHRMGIKKAFCFDRHFMAAGFEKIP